MANSSNTVGYGGNGSKMTAYFSFKAVGGN